MINNIKKILPIIWLWISAVFLILSLVFLFINAKSNTTIQNSEISEISEAVSEYIDKNNIKITQEVKDFSIDNYNIDSVDFFKLNTALSPQWLEQCNTLKNNEELFNLCNYNHFFSNYSSLLNKKWIIDKNVCEQIENFFWVDNYLSEKCNFIYAINLWSKFKNINVCNEYIKESVKNKSFSRESCVENTAYSVYSWDRTLWNYFLELKERGELDNSQLWQQVINKYGEYFKWEFEGAELYEYSLKEFLTKEKELYNKNISN